MKEIIAYEMLYNKALKYQNYIICVPFQKEYWNEYMKIYNECFYKMRKALEVEPINFYYDYSQIKDKIKDIFLYLQSGVIIGAISCYENELDDLIVEKSFRGQGIGQKLLLWGMNHIKDHGEFSYLGFIIFDFLNKHIKIFNIPPVFDNIISTIVFKIF